MDRVMKARYSLQSGLHWAADHVGSLMDDGSDDVSGDVSWVVDSVLCTGIPVTSFFGNDSIASD